MISKEFYKQLEDVCSERGLTMDQMLGVMETSLKNAYKRTFGNTSVRVEFRPEKNEILMYSQYTVVNSYDDVEPGYEPIPILLYDAKKKNSRAKVGDVLEEQFNIKDFGRVAAGQAKQVMNQNIKNCEKENSYRYFKNMENEMINVQIIAQDEKYLTVSIGQGLTTLLPKTELLPSDDFQTGERIQVYVTRVEQGTKGPKVYVSRNDKHLVIRLLEKYITEIAEGIVEIKGIARDPGDRCKIALYSKNPDVDPIGAAVGKDGARIRDVVSALGGEKIDLYEWSEEPKTLIANSLQPTKVIAVINVDTKAKTSLAIVPDSQLSLAIGKNGQNVRLAVQSCDWKIDIKSESVALEQGYEWD